VKLPFLRHTNPRRIIEGGVLILLGGAILLLIPVEIQRISGMETKLSPSFLPSTVAILLILMGLALVIQGILPPRPVESKSTFTSRESTFRVLLSIVLLIVYSILFPIIGFVATSALFFFIYAYLFGMRNLIKMTGGGIAASVIVWLFFEKLFNIPLPHGVLF